MRDDLTNISRGDLKVLKASVQELQAAIDGPYEQAPIFRSDYWREILQDVDAELKRRA